MANCSVLVPRSARLTTSRSTRLPLATRGIELMPVDVPTYFADPSPTAELETPDPRRRERWRRLPPPYITGPAPADIISFAAASTRMPVLGLLFGRGAAMIAPRGE